MNPIYIDQQFHGYKRGHQLLSSSCRLSSVDQDVITYLSDLSGPLEPGQTFSPYLTGYPLPSGDYYVLGKTWQDLDVERSGCVFTRSFLVPIGDWLTIDHVWRLAEELGSNEKPPLNDHKHSYSDQQLLIKPVEGAQSVLLAKTIFLKDQSPVTWFGPADAEPIVMRLLQSDKSVLRMRFSFCTFSLAPRSIEGTPLYLQFAPLASRSRFAQWDGQKIGNDYEVVQLENEPELKTLVDAVFLAKEPDIRSIDETGIFWSIDGEQTVPIKIVILWNRMLREATESPAALLGLLDISSTLGALAPSALIYLKPIVQVWLDKWSAGFSDERPIDFLVSFFAKIRNTKAELWNDLPLRAVVSSAVRQAPSSAIQKLTLSLDKTSWVFDLVMSSIGDGLVHLDSIDLNNLLQDNFSNNRIFDLMMGNHELSQLIADSDILEGVDVASAFEGFAEDLEQSRADVFRQVVFSTLWKKEHLPLLVVSTKTLDEELMMNGIVELFQNDRPISREFDDVLLENVSITKILPKLQNIILETVETAEVDRFIAATIVHQPTTLQILSEFDDRSTTRLQSIIGQLLQNHTDDALRKVFDYEGNGIVAAVIADQLVYVEAKVAISILSHINFPSLQAVEAAFRCYDIAGKTTAKNAAFQSIRFALQLDLPRAADILQSIGTVSLDKQQASSLCFVRRDYRPEVVERNFGYMAENWKGTSGNFPFSCNQTIQPLISFGLDKFSPTLWLSLGAILGEVLSKNQHEYETGAGLLLGAALELTNSDVSGLLEITFPIVHTSLKRNRREPSVYSPFYYTDWDKCKTARTELVRTYMRSNWPEESLLAIAVRIEESYSIYSIIHLEYSGEEYMKKLIESVDRLPKNIQKSLENQAQYARRGSKTARFSDLI